jgi:hypothetical protein
MRNLMQVHRIVTDLPFSVGDTVRFTRDDGEIVAGDVGLVEHMLDLRPFVTEAQPRYPLQGVTVTVWRLRAPVVVVIYDPDPVRWLIEKVESPAT